MLLFENISLALSGIRSNKSRSFLTMLGIIIGIASVISIMTIGNSMTKAMDDNMSSGGANQITVMVTEKSDDDFFFGEMEFNRKQKPMRDGDYITADKIEKLKARFGDRILGVGLEENAGEGTAKDGDLYAYAQVNGVNADQLISDVPELIAGRYFYDTDYKKGRKVAIVSDYLVNNMFGGDTDKALGQELSVVINKRYYYYTIVGVYEYEEDQFSFSTSSDKDTRTKLYLPLYTAKLQTHNRDEKYSGITVIGASAADATALNDDIESYMNDTFYRSNKNYEISTFSMTSLLNSFKDSMAMITLAISLIAGIALLVGGIGVMNIMMVSITERTREIGTRKALGATNASIRIQFIVESIVLCIVGGFFGIIIGLIIGAAASKAMGYPASPSALSIFVSVGFSAFIGIFFGYYPANKAAKMNPIDALRYE